MAFFSHQPWDFVTFFAIKIVGQGASIVFQTLTYSFRIILPKVMPISAFEGVETQTYS